MDWWIWILLGLLLCVAELTTPGGFYILFFGIGAVIVGILVGFQAAGPPGFNLSYSPPSRCFVFGSSVKNCCS